MPPSYKFYINSTNQIKHNFSLSNLLTIGNNQNTELKIFSSHNTAIFNSVFIVFLGDAILLLIVSLYLSHICFIN